MFKKRFYRLIQFSILFVFILTLYSNYKVYSVSKDHLYDDVTKVPYYKVGVLLGTSRYLVSGKENAYFYNRIEATVRLFKNNKIKLVLISGDNSSKEYNEPEDMKAELIKRGVPSKSIYLDFAGFDTFDSMIRANKVFGLKRFIVISQAIHNKRAIYIARESSIDAIGYNAEEVDAYFGLKTNIREVFACVKAFFDVHFHSKPQFLGKEEKIE